MTEFTLDRFTAQLRSRIGPVRYSKQIDAALRLAWEGHSGQYREQGRVGDAKVPYIIHPVGVAIIASELMPLVTLPDNFDDVLSVCLTHDLLEDCDVSAQGLERATSRRTSELVQALTKPAANAVDSRRRNEQAFSRIVQAGPTAMFVKLCDHLHNVSRPDQSPPDLLKKALRKGWDLYLRFFEGGALSEGLRAEYVRRIRASEEAWRALVSVDNVAPKITSLSDALRYCVSASEQKILEMHDIIEVLRVVSDARFVLKLRPDDFIEMALNESALRAEQRLRSRLRSLIREGGFSAKEIPAEAGGDLLVGVDRVFAIGISSPVGLREADLLFIGLHTGVATEWLDLDALRVVVAYLSDRLRTHGRSVLTSLANYVAQLGLEVAAEDVARLNLDHADLDRLSETIRRAEYLRGIIAEKLIYEFDIDRTGLRFPSIESRTKTAGSLLRKMIARKYTSFSEIDDLVGIRLICGSTREAKDVAERTSKIISGMMAAETRVAAGSESSIQELNTRAGYRGYHMSLVLADQGGLVGGIGCECQFRSAFQDAWARVSHQVSYKGGKQSNAGYAESMKKLAALRDDMDRIIDDVV